MQKLQGWVEQGNTTLTIGQAAGVIARKVQGSYPGATVTVYINSAPAVAISSISRTANVVTVTIPSGSGFIAGEQVTIASVTDASFNGTFTILTSGATTFTYAQTAANASSSGGTATSTLRLATIYSDNAASPTSKANPFVSASDGTWFLYAANGRYDVKFSGAGIATPFTLGDFSLGVAGSGVPSYALAALPTSNSQNAGNLARVTDDQGGLWMDSGAQWVKEFPVINVKDAPFNAKGDGATDDVVGIQAAITACPDSGTVFFPTGIYKCTSALTVGDKSIRLVGAGWWTRNNSAFGNAEWTDLTRSKGTILYFPNATNGIVHQSSLHQYRHAIQDLMVLGPGSGATIGVTAGSNTVSLTRLFYSNVGIFNFATGVEWRSINEGATYSLSIAACTTGFNSAFQNNQCCHYQTEVQFCAIGIKVVTADTENFYGGLTQNCTTNGILLDSCNVCVVDGFHHENSLITDYDIKVVNVFAASTSSLVISNHRISSNITGGISIVGDKVIVSNNRILSAGNLILQATSGNCIAISNNIGVSALIDNGDANVLLFNNAVTTTVSALTSIQDTITGGGGGQKFNEVRRITNAAQPLVIDAAVEITGHLVLDSSITGNATATGTVAANALSTTTTISVGGDPAQDHLNSGTYTPTASGLINTTVVTTRPVAWMRIGSTIVGGGFFTCDTTASPATTQFDLTLPAGIVIGGLGICAGTGVGSDNSGGVTGPWQVTAASTTKLRLRGAPSIVAAAQNFSFHFILSTA